MRITTRGVWVVGITWSFALWGDPTTASGVATQTVTTHRTEQSIQIKSGSDEQINQEVKYFCSTTSKDEAEKNCNQWLTAQKQSAGPRVLFASCSQAKYLYGENQQGCMAYLCTGEVKFILNPHK